MDLWRAALWALAPALFLLWLFWRRDKWQREPRLLVLRLFGLGALAAAPVYFLEAWMPGPATPVFDNFVRVGLVEELGKFLPFWLFAYRHREFDEPMDGIVYAVAAALGFAAVENALYASFAGGTVLVYRTFTSTLAHVGFSGLVGYACGRAKFMPRGGFLLGARALLAAVALHGAYNLLLQIGSAPGAPTLVARGTLALLVPALLLLLTIAARLAEKASPFAQRRESRHASGSTASETRSIVNATAERPTWSEPASRR